MANVITTATTAADFEEIGILKLSDMKTIPFYGYEYNNVRIKRTDPVLCKEFDGDCEKFVAKYLKMDWLNGEFKVEHGPFLETHFKGRICTADDIPKRHMENGLLYMCPPSELLTVYRNYESLIYKSFAVKYYPNYDYKIEKGKVLTEAEARNKAEVDAEVNKFVLTREQMNQVADFSDSEGKPITS
jgi:hypothetical protein